ncbi:MAG: hypothetical protein LDL12_06280 [Anaerolinea sp.]|nr:hypothetical protein [Anaerolinea sp.]
MVRKSDFWWALGVGVIGGGALAAVQPGGLFSRGWLSFGLLMFGAVLSLAMAWRASGAGRSMAWVMGLAFVLRLTVAVVLFLGLPRWGDPTDVQQQAGYEFFDAYHRDAQAWQLASSDQPLSQAFGEELYMDQYGGLLWLSAWCYRFLSPDLQRPLLVVVLGAWLAALGSIFLYRALRGRFEERAALAAAWIYALYPEGVLMGASQMREPFLMGLSAIAFWAVAVWPLRSSETTLHRPALAALLGAALLGLGLFSWRAALPIVAVLLVWFWLENTLPRRRQWLRTLGWVVLALALLVGLALSWRWLRDVAAWDALLAERSSGMLQAQMQKLPDFLKLPFVTLYGLFQPVLPAALIETALPIHRAISVGRALGWYLLAPVLLYGSLIVRRAERSRRPILVLTMVVCVGWILISSLRAGGDQWDNPRYRVIVLPWLALLAGWAWERARRLRDAWLGRIFFVEGIFLAFFTHWYWQRYLSSGQKLPFFGMIGLILACSALFLALCWLWDRWRARRSSR